MSSVLPNGLDLQGSLSALQQALLNRVPNPAVRVMTTAALLAGVCWAGAALLCMVVLALSVALGIAAACLLCFGVFLLCAACVAGLWACALGWATLWTWAAVAAAARVYAWACSLHRSLWPSAAGSSDTPTAPRPASRHPSPSQRHHSETIPMQPLPVSSSVPSPPRPVGHGFHFPGLTEPWLQPQQAPAAAPGPVHTGDQASSKRGSPIFAPADMPRDQRLQPPPPSSPPPVGSPARRQVDGHTVPAMSVPGLPQELGMPGGRQPCRVDRGSSASPPPPAAPPFAAASGGAEAVQAGAVVKAAAGQPETAAEGESQAAGGSSTAAATPLPASASDSLLSEAASAAACVRSALLAAADHTVGEVLAAPTEGAGAGQATAGDEKAPSLRPRTAAGAEHSPEAHHGSPSAVQGGQGLYPLTPHHQAPGPLGPSWSWEDAGCAQPQLPLPPSPLLPLPPCPAPFGAGWEGTPGGNWLSAATGLTFSPDQPSVHLTPLPTAQKAGGSTVSFHSAASGSPAVSLPGQASSSQSGGGCSDAVSAASSLSGLGHAVLGAASIEGGDAEVVVVTSQGRAGARTEQQQQQQQQLAGQHKRKHKHKTQQPQPQPQQQQQQQQQQQLQQLSAPVAPPTPAQSHQQQQQERQQAAEPIEHREAHAGRWVSRNEG